MADDVETRIVFEFERVAGRPDRGADRLDVGQAIDAGALLQRVDRVRRFDGDHAALRRLRRCPQGEQSHVRADVDHGVGRTNFEAGPCITAFVEDFSHQEVGRAAHLHRAAKLQAVRQIERFQRTAAGCTFARIDARRARRPQTEDSWAGLQGGSGQRQRRDAPEEQRADWATPPRAESRDVCYLSGDRTPNEPPAETAGYSVGRSQGNCDILRSNSADYKPREATRTVRCVGELPPSSGERPV